MLLSNDVLNDALCNKTNLKGWRDEESSLLRFTKLESLAMLISVDLREFIFETEMTRKELINAKCRQD